MVEKACVVIVADVSFNLAGKQPRRGCLIPKGGKVVCSLLLIFSFLRIEIDR
jgi:hypothetical protein